jgi:hypothetical protein
LVTLGTGVVEAGEDSLAEVEAILVRDIEPSVSLGEGSGDVRAIDALLLNSLSLRLGGMRDID